VVILNKVSDLSKIKLEGKKVWISGSRIACLLNQNHIERLRNYFLANGFTITRYPSEANLVVHSGCGFTETAEKCSINELEEIRNKNKSSYYCNWLFTGYIR